MSCTWPAPTRRPSGMREDGTLSSVRFHCMFRYYRTAQMLYRPMCIFIPLRISLMEGVCLRTSTAKGACARTGRPWQHAAAPPRAARRPAAGKGARSRGGARRRRSHSSSAPLAARAPPCARLPAMSRRSSSEVQVVVAALAGACVVRRRWESGCGGTAVERLRFLPASPAAVLAAT